MLQRLLCVVIVAMSSLAQPAPAFAARRTQSSSAPTVQIISPSIHSGNVSRPVRAGAPQRFAIAAFSPEGIVAIELLVGGQPVARQEVNGRAQVNVVLIWQPAANGDVPVAARAIDRAGREATSPPLSVPVRGAEGALGSMIQVPAGAFTMGDDAGQPDERPARVVQLPAYQIDRYEVTVGEFRGFVRATNHLTSAEAEGRPTNETWRVDAVGARFDRPVRYVSWWDADRYCRWRGKRLPSEAEWERAARGEDGRRFAWGNDFDAGRVAAGDTAPVGYFINNGSPVGAYDMSGNVWEWVNDWYRADYYGQADNTANPQGPQQADQRVIRGGSFSNGPDDLRVTRRIKDDAGRANRDVGFRCAS